MFFLGGNGKSEYLSWVQVAEVHCSRLSRLSARDAQALHLRNQRRALQTESGGRSFRASDDSVGFGQCLNDMVALGIF